ncbi:MAG: AtpZ/AtpI family protein [Pyrinomonadaceae bacterium]|nr:AtpZ/AtpI family protein [Pyrinomonadaceae bacterium]
MPEDDEQEVTRKSGMAYAAVFSMVGAVVVCLLVGWVLDSWLGTSPWLLVGGIVLGSIVGFYEFIRVLSKV